MSETTATAPSVTFETSSVVGANTLRVEARADGTATFEVTAVTRRRGAYGVELGVDEVAGLRRALDLSVGLGAVGRRGRHAGSGWAGDPEGGARPPLKVRLARRLHRMLGTRAAAETDDHNRSEIARRCIEFGLALMPKDWTPETGTPVGDLVVVPTATLAAIEESLHGGTCIFWACPGPDAPAVGMATCRVCWAVQDIRRLLGRGVPEPEDAEA